MKKKWIVLRTRPLHRNAPPTPDGERPTLIYQVAVPVDEPFIDDLYKARAEATRRASRDGEDWYVAEILGKQTPVYDPEIGWEPAE